MAYTKLFSSIVTSTIWMEDDRTRIVWITMLACADKNGEVQASIPGLARIAGVPVEACRAAIEKFLSPDADSRSEVEGGRRIEKIDGGWALINYRKYRDMASDEDRRRQAAERQQRARDRKSRNNHANVTRSHASVTLESRQIPQAEAEANAESEAKTHFKDSTHDRYKGGVGEDRDGACAHAIEKGSESIQSDPKDTTAMSRRLDDKNGSERPKRLKAEAYHEHSRTVLHYLNQATGRNYRELAANLDPISARLNEPGVDLEGVKLMIDRQVKLWGGTEMQEYLKPTTLFRVSKFDGYYASRLVEISRPKTAFEKMCPPPLHDWSKEEGGEIDFASISQEVK